MAHTADDDVGDDLHTDQLPRKKFSGKKLVLFVILPLLLLIGAGLGIYFSGVLDAVGKKEEHAIEEETPPVDPHAAPVFFDVPEMLVNLNSTGRRPTFLKISVALQLTRPEDVPELQKTMPRVIDNFQVYLRELRLEDLRGSAGIYRLREELLRRVTAAAYPVKIKDVLFKEMLVQ
ncbi:MAG TPA: flagellar basal body-associated FliL family protein [Azospirillaceae bacterium]|nr:flagellar basal body-associated FliL family protein [Azospirillaceae bacterium]